MKIQKIVLILFLFIYNISNAQFGMKSYKKHMEKQTKKMNVFKNSILLVVLANENDSDIKKLINKGKNIDSDLYIKNFNFGLRKAFESDWTMTKRIEFITKDELKKYKKQKNKYSYAKYNVKVTSNYSFYLFGDKLPIKEVTYYEKYMSYADFKFIIQHVQSQKETLDLFKVPQNGQIPTKKFVGRNSKFAKEMRKEQKKIKNNKRKIIKNRILLINKDDVNKKSIEKFKEVYPYQYEIVEKEIIDDVIITNNKKYVYLKSLPTTPRSYGKGYASNNKIYIVDIFNPENGESLFIKIDNFSKTIKPKTVKGIVELLDF